MSSASSNIALLGADILHSLPDELQQHTLLRAVLLNPEDTYPAMAAILNRKGPNVIVPKNLDSEAMVALATSWDLLSVASTPPVLRSMVALMLNEVVPNFKLLSSAKRDAVAAVFSPTAETVQVVRDVAEFVRVSAIADNIKASAAESSDGKIYLTAMHDEGGSGRNKLELLVRFLKADGTVSEAVLIGSLDTSKTGAANARAIKDRLRALGFSPEKTVMLVMVVDGAGRKAAEELKEYGLIYVPVCDAHNLNKEAEQAKVAFVKSKLGMLHPYNMTHNLIKLIRRHIEPEAFFMYAALELNMEILEAGQQLFEAGSIPRSRIPPLDPIDANVLWKLMNTPDIPTLIRWLTIERVCAWIMNTVLIINDSRFVGTILGEEHFTTRGIVLAGLAGVFRHHCGVYWWATDPTSPDDIEKWGKTCRVTSLACQLRHPYMQAELSILGELYTGIFEPALQTIRSHNRRGGGARSMVPETALRLDELARYMQNYESMHTFIDIVPKIVHGDDRTNFESAVQLYLPAIQAKMSEHLDWAIDALPLALGHEWFGLHVADVLLGWLARYVPEFVLPNLEPLQDPGVFSVKSTGGVVRTLSFTADQLAMYVSQNIMRRHGGPTTLAWWPVMVRQRKELLLWRQRGGRFTQDDASEYRDHYERGIMVADSITLKVEKAVNDHNISKRALGSMAITAMREQGRVVLRSLATSVRLSGKDGAADWRASTAAKRPDPDDENRRHTSRSRVAALFTLSAARAVTSGPGGAARFTAARASAQRRRRNADPSKSETVAFKRRIAAERARQEVSKSARQARRERARLAGKTERPEPLDFTASVAAAESAGLSVVHLQPSLFGLYRLGKAEYNKGAMVETLVARRPVSEHAGIRCKNSTQLKRAVLDEFYGEEWASDYAPKNMSRPEQTSAVRKARKMGWCCRIAEGEEGISLI